MNKNAVNAGTRKIPWTWEEVAFYRQAEGHLVDWTNDALTETEEECGNEYATATRRQPA